MSDLDVQRHAIGLVWDEYLPSVEGQITRDLIALKNEAPKCDLVVMCPDSSADRLLKALGVVRGVVPSVASLWITYQTGPDPVAAPEHATTVINRDLHQERTKPNIDPNPGSPYNFPPQGRLIPPTVHVNRPAPAHSGQTDPLVIQRWS